MNFKLQDCEEWGYVPDEDRDMKLTLKNRIGNCLVKNNNVLYVRLDLDEDELEKKAEPVNTAQKREPVPEAEANPLPGGGAEEAWSDPEGKQDDM